MTAETSITGSRRLASLVLLVTLQPLALTVPARAGDAQASDATALRLVEAYNSRHLGQPGLRRVHLELKNEGRIVRSFETLHVWRQDETAVQSLVLLEEPENLRGTSYLLLEDEALAAGMEIYLHLVSGEGKVLRIQPGRFDEGLLGSDFGYTDVLWRIPTRGRALRYVGEGRVAGSTRVWSVESKPVTDAARQSSVWQVIRYHFSRDPVLLLGADYYDTAPTTGAPGGIGSGGRSAGTPSKRLRISGWQRSDGVWTPSLMVMVVNRDRKSVIRLKSARFHLDSVAPEWFSPDSLPQLARQLVTGSLPKPLEDLP